MQLGEKSKSLEREF